MQAKENRPTARSSGAQVIKVIQVDTFNGEGSKESPYKGITEYWSLDGELLAVKDHQEVDDAALAVPYLSS